MNVILLEAVENLGSIGDLVKVKPGYGRNYLVPQGLAVVASSRNLSELEHHKRQLARKAEKLSQEAADIIGFSVVTNQWPYARKLADWARGATDAIIVCGGIHTMAAGEQILQSGHFDYIIRGEAEEAFAEFVEKIK